MTNDEDTCVLCGITIVAPPGLPDYNPEHHEAHRCLCLDCVSKWHQAMTVRATDCDAGKGESLKKDTL